MDQVTYFRLKKFITGFHTKYGKDPSEKELKNGGFTSAVLGEALQKEFVTKYQVTSPAGVIENRFKVMKDWKSLNS